MFPTNIKGKKFEAVATSYLKKLGYKIIENNYKNSIGEIDIICLDGSTLVFVEVKYRISKKFGLPIEAITPYKQQKLKVVATKYLKEKRKLDSEVRFDAIEILNDEIRHIMNIF